jgi:hypothetical protein
MSDVIKNEEDKPLYKDVNEELFTVFNPDEELWMAAGTTSNTPPCGRNGGCADTDFDFSTL